MHSQRPHYARQKPRLLAPQFQFTGQEGLVNGIDSLNNEFCNLSSVSQHIIVPSNDCVVDGTTFLSSSPFSVQKKESPRHQYKTIIKWPLS